jgi:tetratricopeptide (TPR) repeat protein
MPSPGIMRFGLIGALSLAILPGLARPIQAQDQSVQVREELGRVQFPISCRPESQAQFERGASFLHSFRWKEADKEFREIAVRDSTCAMAEWGLAMALRGNPFLGEPPEANLREAWSLLSSATNLEAVTPREREYLEAVTVYFRNAGQHDHGARSLIYEVKMRELTQRYPDDLEARVFYARAVAANAIATDTTLERRVEIGAELDSLLASHPAHPGIAHYLIHIYDHPALAHRGLDAAHRFARSAPQTDHARHIPSHIYTRLGMWDEVIEANTFSLEVSREGVDSTEEAEEINDLRVHALDFLVYAYLQQGRDNDARKVVKELARLQERAPDARLLEPAHHVLAAVPARYALERRDWAGAATLPEPEASGSPSAQAVTRFARALGAARNRDLETTRAEFEKLLAVERSMPNTRGPWRRRTEAQRLAISAWVAFAQGDTTSALLLAAEAADREDSLEFHPALPPPVVPTRELLGDLLIEMWRYEDAGAEYEAVLQSAPNRARSLFGAAWSAQLLGEHESAADWFMRYLTLTQKGDGDRPEVVVAEAYVRRYARRQ